MAQSTNITTIVKKTKKISKVILIGGDATTGHMVRKGRKTNDSSLKIIRTGIKKSFQRLQVQKNDVSLHRFRREGN